MIAFRLLGDLEMKRSFFLVMALLPGLAHAQPQLSLFKADSLAVRKGFLLITVAGDDTHPRLYDLATGKLLFQADDVYGVSFWDFGQ